VHRFGLASSIAATTLPGLAEETAYHAHLYPNGTGLSVVFI
jgi:hypothetical protein